ncbi:MAG: glycosyltransferase family 4 protein [Egibacteraceae bacterium]
MKQAQQTPATASMRILLLGPHPPYSGGSAYSCRELSSGLRALGHEVHHFAPHPSFYSDETPGVRWIPTQFHSDGLAIDGEWVEAMNLVVAAGIDELGPFDHVVLGRESFLWNLPGLRTRHHGPITLVCRGAYVNHLAHHGDKDPRIATRLAELYRSCDQIVCVARHLVPTLTRISRHPHIRFIPNPIDLDTAIAASSSRSSAASSMPLRLLFAGQLKTRKRPADVVRVLERLLLTGVDAELTVCGEGPLEESLRTQVADGVLTHHVRLLGNIEHDRLLAMLPAFDVVLLLSEHEGRPRILQEAVAARRAVVASTTPGSREAVEGWPLSRLVSIGDIAAAAAAAQQLGDIIRRPGFEPPAAVLPRPDEALAAFELALRQLSGQW